MFKEFKKFLIQGNMVDMAIGFIFGGAFSTVIKSLVDNVIMPPIGMLLGKVNFSQLYIELSGKTYDSLDAATKAGSPVIKYGQFINDIISFIILGFVIFIFIRAYNKIKEPVVEETPAVDENILLLRDIRDSLKKK
ncbi:MAG: large conductance mechanosensitive channel protein MscL [Sulfurovaceae bacterium]|nr:large conductance mechanosensitive channel protein MscL [Sulfurovaceae bacterium]MDD5549125.1 large conductance mechanosensitive channel protein MscL [Sulfurovaceae bacterium]